MPKQKENTNQLWVYISDELRDALRHITTKEGKSMSAYVRKLIRDDVARNLFKKGAT